MTNRHLLAIALAVFTTAPLMAGDKHKTDKGDKHEKHDDDSTEVEIKESEVPAKVAAGFKKAFPDAKVKKVEKETYKDGTVHYEYEFTTAEGEVKDVELNADGEVLPDHKDDHDDKHDKK